MKNTNTAQEAVSVDIESFSLPRFRQRISESAKMRSLVQKCEENAPSISASSVYGSLAPILTALMFETLQRPVLLVCNEERVDLFENDLRQIAGTKAICDFVSEPSHTLATLAAEPQKITIASTIELQKKVLPKKEALEKQVQLHENEPFGYETLISFLQETGFDQKDFVESEGDFSVRGSVVDVFSFGAASPVRIEFFGDEPESIRFFDINSQLSKENIPSISIVSNLIAGEDAETECVSLLDYLPPNTLIVLDGYDTLQFEDSDAGVLEESQIRADLETFQQVRFHQLSPADIDFASAVIPKFNSNFALFSQHIRQAVTNEYDIVVATKSKKELQELVEFISVAPFEQFEMDSKNSPVPDELLLNSLHQNLYEGFHFEDTILYTESDVFGKLHSHKQHRRRKHRKISLRELRALKVGDYIVHEDYGIGVFMGMEKTKVGGSEQECVLVEYEKGDKLFVNIQNLHLLSKYSSAEGKIPTLSKLGSNKWQANKEKIKKRLKDIARNLIAIYAKRKMTKGFACKQDSVWQREFEAAFIFDETPDQMSAIEAIKADMEAVAPMDRLVCGDAGFGKTEVAMRAAFKAVESGKQVAVLVPTTILAHQHFNTFKLRFQNFPMRVEVLSRFVPKKSQKAVISEIAAGKVDIVVGTHRIVSKDVKFNDLGLLIIDEEQHFGVAAKEKLREDFPSVDTLVMSATPIPRTLQFSMMGARDLSIISTPPKNRQPVETIIHEFDAEMIKQAIGRETGRGGQVFFLHNRINSIAEMYELVKKLFPRARVGVAHGQMPTKELESVMLDFIQKELDVLVSTAIVGSGLDISNANTIIINRADMFGLSDLYQLRGRVGRSDKKAFSYLFTPPLSTLKQDALQRLAVIEAYTELGSGFSVAMRDLDIRGAGNLLGAEQSGFIFDLGFDVYQKILEEAVLELKSTEFQNIFAESERLKLQPKKPCEVIFFFDALIPAYYVESASERFALYEKLSKASSYEALDQLGAELNDRFGKMPEECQSLFDVGILRILGTELELQRIEISETKIAIFLPEGENKAFYEGKKFEVILASVQSDWLAKFSPQFRNEKKLKIILSFAENMKKRPQKALNEVIAILRKLKELVGDKE